MVLINNLSVLQIRILKFMSEPSHFLAEADIDEQNVRGGFADIFRVVLPGSDPDLVKSAFGDLFQIGLINTDKSIFHTMTSAQGLHLLGDRVAPIGRRFIDFVRPPTM